MTQLLLRATALLTIAMSASASAGSAQALRYPDTERGAQVDDYHGTRVADPYRWLEDTDAAATRAWIEAQNRVTFGHLKSIPARDSIQARLTALWNYERFGVPFREGGRYFYFRNDGLQNQSVLYVQPSLDGPARVLLDPNALSADGTVALSSVNVSRDGRYLIYGTSSGGSDWQELRVREVESGRDLPDVVRRVKFSSAAWQPGARGFFYGRYPEPTGNALTTANVDHKLYFHRIGTDQSADVLVWEQPDQPEWRFNPEVTDDGRYLVITVSESTSRNRLFVRDLGDPQRPRMDGPVTRVVDAFDANYSLVGNDGPVLYLLTDRDAPRGRVVAVDLRDPAYARWRTVIPEGEDVLENVRIVNDHFVATYLHDAHTRLRIHAMDGRPVREVELPGIGAVAGVSGERDDREAFFAFTSFLYPTTIFRYDFATGRTERFRAPEVDFDPELYVTRQHFYTSRDGTRVPMFVTHRKDIKLDGSNPTMLYGYGGFNVNLTPGFSVSTLAWLEMGGVYAVPNLRGGGEYGEEWHRAGTLERKQNVFDDFIAAAEFLIREGYTSPRKLAIRGGSNGGLLVGAAMTQRPELFGAALPAVGVLDMLRYHRFTIGRAWATDYGTAEEPESFRYLYAYSPLHNLKPGTCYPATLITTGDHDDRVVPGHSFKFAAALQAAQGCARPTLIRVETRAGHGAGKPTAKVIEEQADVLGFLVKELRM